MRMTKHLALIVGTVAAMSQASAQEANAQGVVMQRNLSLAMAKTIAEATLADCKSKGYNTSAAELAGVLSS